MGLIDVRRNIINSQPHLETASGGIASFNTDIAAPLNISIPIEPQQDLHGYDYPWPPGCGKNLAKVSGRENGYNGLTYQLIENDGNTIGVKYTGTTNKSGGIAPMSSVSFEEDTPIVVMMIVEGTYSGYAFIWDSDTSSQVARSDNVNNIFRFTATAGHRYAISLYFANGQTVDVTMYPFLSVDDSEDAIFSPYSNVSPFQGLTEANIYKSSFNMIDQDDLLKAPNWTRSSTEGFITYGDYNAPVYTGTIANLYSKYKNANTILPIVNAKPGIQYTVSLWWRSVAEQSKNGLKLHVVYTDGTDVSVPPTTQSANQTWTRKTFTTDINKVPAGVYFPYNNSFSIYMSGLMCIPKVVYDAIGDTTFVCPNDMRAIPLEWSNESGLVYKGTITYNGHGTWTLHQAYTLATVPYSYFKTRPSGYIGHDDSSGGFFWIRNFAYDASDGISYRNRGRRGGGYYCKSNVFNTFYLNNTGYMSSQYRLRFGDMGLKTLQEFYDLIDELEAQNIPIQFLYEPTDSIPDTIITTEELLSLIGQNSIWSDLDNISVDYWKYK